MDQRPHMTDADATELDYWLLDLLRDQLFNPKANENKQVTGAGDAQLDATGLNSTNQKII